MPNSIGPTGLQVSTRAEILANLISAFQLAYGADINTAPSTPDGQALNIFTQAVMDQGDLLVQIYNSFDPDNAIGVTLDQRVAINGIQRQAGTFTVTNITVVTTAALNLYGLDQTLQPVFTVQDAAGNQWQLQTSQTIGGSGTYVYAFQAKVAGALTTLPNTIIIPVTIVLGVASVNNPTVYTTLGVNEETDAALKIRRQKSVSLASQGYLAGLLAALENVSGMNFVAVYENVTGSVNADGVPGHSLWVVVSGTAAAIDIANAIYQKRNAGCGMYGSISQNIVQADGSNFLVLWDTVVSEALFIKFTTTSLDGVNPPNIAAIRAGLVTGFVPGVNQEVNINGLGTSVQKIDPNTLVTLAGFSVASGGSYTNILSPTTKKYQFAVTSPNIIILPMILNPVTAVVVHGGNTKQFTALGGFQPNAFSMQSGAGSVDSVTGVYTSSTIGTDVVLVTDILGNTATATVTIT